MTNKAIEEIIMERKYKTVTKLICLILNIHHRIVLRRVYIRNYSI